MNEWISVSDRLPDAELANIKKRSGADEVEIIVKIACGEYATTLCWDGLSFTDSHGFAYTVTHWMPMPEPPKVAQ